MRQRKHRVQVRMDEDEFAFFLNQVKKTGLTQEAYLRKIIAGRVPRAAENVANDREIIRQLQAIGNLSNQMTRIAYSTGGINIRAFHEAMDLFQSTMEAFLHREDQK